MHYTSASVSRMKGRKGKPWRGTLSYVDAWGKRRQIRKVFKGVELKRDAQIALNKWRDEMEERFEMDSVRTVERAVSEYLEHQLAFNQINNVTFQNSNRLMKKSVYPYIGNYVFIDVTGRDLQRLVDELAGKYKPQSVRTVYAIVSKTFKDAFRRGEVPCDPTLSVVLPRVMHDEINYLDAEGRERFFDVLDEGSQFYLPAMIAYYTGMRAGEICALKYADIDFSIKTITVGRAAKQVKDSEGNTAVEISQTKTHKKRVVPLLFQLESILQREFERNDRSTADYVVSRRDPRLLCTSFLKWSTRHNVRGSAGKPISMHGLRHTFASLGVQSGMDIKSLSSILGHASTAMTLDIYASSDEQAKRLAMERFGQYLSMIG